MPNPLDDSKASFVDLPAELRNQIYQYCLVTHERLEFRPVHRPGATSSSAPENVVILCEPVFPVPQILQSCRHVRDEASAILYGENTFHITNPDCIGWVFFRQIGQNIRHIRYVSMCFEIDHWLLASFLATLKPATNLCMLEVAIELMMFAFDWGLRARVKEELIEGLTPLMRHVQDQRRGTDKTQALDALKWRSTPPRWVEDIPEARENYRRVKEEAGSEIYALLADRLKLDGHIRGTF
ncbi:hypothetical protein Slin15195_G127990 [Septoria linicola]|uniref:2EXR domain-containing protein n=1 Tax=Septoria linicola TaxID=215465 RepID=A0A9Q9B2J8_9PEZI|nr:hypothetical protein Slin15195_G127990 [Septoria linicola]